MKIRLLYLLFSYFCVTIDALPQSTNVWSGEWVGEINNVGKVAITLSEPRQGQSQLFWVFQTFPIQWSADGDSIVISVTGRGARDNASPPSQFKLEKQPSGTLKITPYGLVTEERLSIFESTVFSRVPGGTFYRLSSFRINGSQYEQFVKSGQLQPLPTNFPTAFMDISVLLCRNYDHELFALLKHPHISPEVLKQITEDTLKTNAINDGALQSLPPVLAANPNISKDDLQRLFDLPASYEQMSPLIWRAAALNPNAPSSFRQIYLERIKNGDWRTRVWVARDREAPREAWELALAPKESSVLSEFSHNPNAPPDLLKQLALSGGADGRALAGNASTPPEILEQLASSTDNQVLWALLRNKACPNPAALQALSFLTTNRSAFLRASIGKDLRLAPDMLSALAKDPNIQVRTMIAMNEAAPFEILAALANDPYQQISSRARDNLQARFPKEVQNVKPQWKPLDSLLPFSDLNAEFADAVKKSNESRAHELLVFTDDPETRVSPQVVIENILQFNFDKFSPLLLDTIQQGGNDTKNTFFGSGHLTPEELIWADRQNLLDTNAANQVLQATLENGNSNLLSAVLETKAGEQISDRAKAEALFKATGYRSIPFIDILLKHGAKPDYVVQTIYVPTNPTNRASMMKQDLAAVDLAAKSYFVDGLTRLDKNGKYKKLMADFRKEFPPTKSSPFVGLWDNHKDGFYTSRFNLSPDATGVIGISLFSGPIAWKSSEQGVKIFFIDENGIARDKIITMVANSNKTELVWSRTNEESEIYRRDKKDEQ